MTVRRKLLLHICCAPCGVHVYEDLVRRGWEVDLFFYNPNIHPYEEYKFRYDEILKVAGDLGMKVITGEYDDNRWFTRCESLKDEPERGRRCLVCFYIRLRETFMRAEKNGYDAVATTLSISPYKSLAQINTVGEKLSSLFKIKFLGENFKKADGYNKARKRAASLDIKHQNYCGCIYSLRDRERKTGARR